ncbi:unnamed protein product [Didymodactylos carnosus]|uniref:Reverse transcriptase domain-containing protein n=1 Tax=Didymodactylos carnosus TaxID=1234261 RepID=A0A814FFC1_9BILA|nr:unnamed protein product [Didymodactylos carnosus]CAF3755034.1 unnamed protein product [Didymodactylos carnosus]
MFCNTKSNAYPRKNDLRPISILNAIGKVYEKVLHPKYHTWLKENKIIPHQQSGFQANIRLQTRVLSVYEEARQCIATNRPGLILFVDFVSAFDKVWHKALLVKLARFHLPSRLWLWLRSWLSDRSAYVSFGGLESDVFYIEWGLPQGSVISPLIYIPYLADLVEIKEPVRKDKFFADDWSLFFSVPYGLSFSTSCTLLQRQGQEAFDKIHVYCEYWLVELSVTKTVAMLIHSQIQVPSLKLIYNGHEIKFVNKFTDLDYLITSKLGLGQLLNLQCSQIFHLFKLCP